jgi:L-glutamine-phosphate cytidylyltransferase
MKAIVLAAGRGSRMGKSTKNLPKSFMIINGNEKLIENIIKKFSKKKIQVKVITGYKYFLFKYLKSDFIKLKKNNLWKSCNISSSLYQANEILSKNICIVSYADIYYQDKAINLLTNDNKKDGITILSYLNWKKLWTKRFKNPLSDLETFKFSSDKKLLEIGNKPKSIKDINGQYMGLFKITPSAWKKIKKFFRNNNKDLFKLDITSLFSVIIKNGICNIYVKDYNGLWFEVDNCRDLKILRNSIEN